MVRIDRDREGASVRRGRATEAIGLLRKRLSEDPEDPDLRCQVAEAYAAAANLERALHHLGRAAQIYRTRGEIARACEALRRADSVSPNEPEIVFRLAESYLAAREGEAAEATLRRLAQVATASGDRRRLFALDELLKIHPDDLEIAVRRAEALSETARTEEALEAWRAVYAPLESRGLDPFPSLFALAQGALDAPKLGADIARLLLERGRPDEALEVLRLHHDRSHDDPDIVSALVSVLEVVGPVARLIEAQALLVSILTRRQEKDSALRAAIKLTAIAPANTAALEVAAAAYVEFDRSKDAAFVLLRLARAYEAAHRPVDRDRVLTSLLEHDPRNRDGLELTVRALREAGQEADAQTIERLLARADTGENNPTEVGDNPSRSGTHLLVDADIVEEVLALPDSSAVEDPTSPVEAEDVALARSTDQLRTDVSGRVVRQGPPAPESGRHADSRDERPEDLGGLLFADDQDTSGEHSVSGRLRAPRDPLDPREFESEPATLTGPAPRGRPRE